jgi:hypothetical protein
VFLSQAEIYLSEPEVFISPFLVVFSMCERIEYLKADTILTILCFSLYSPKNGTLVLAIHRSPYTYCEICDQDDFQVNPAVLFHTADRRVPKKGRVSLESQPQSAPFRALMPIANAIERNVAICKTVNHSCFVIKARGHCFAARPK